MKKALANLKILEKMGCNDNPLPLRTFPGFDNLRDKPEFKSIMKNIEENRVLLRKQVKELEQKGELSL